MGSAPVARIRTIKPEFWMHEDLSALPEATHMLGAALLNLADDEGYFNANPGLVKASCSPLREPSVSVHDSLNLLLSCGYIGLCTGTDGKRYGRVVKFIEHQRINRPTPSKIKHLCQSWEESVSAHTQLSEDSHPERKGKEQGKERKGTKAPPPEQPQAPPAAAAPDFKSDLFARWKALPNGGGGAFLNKLFRDHKPDQRVVEAVERTLDDTRADPKAFVLGVLTKQANGDDREAELWRNVK